VLLSPSCVWPSGPLLSSPCELLPVGDDHPVQALSKSFTVLAGCASQGTSALPQEVHIINLRGPGEERPGRKHAEVTLQVKPIQSMHVHQKPLVFVLNSAYPVVWKLQTENLTPDVSRTFHVSEGSRVQFEPGNFSLSCVVVKEKLPHGNEQLLSWAQQKYKAVTSFSEVKATKEIFIKVGEETDSHTCKIVNNFLSLNYLAGYEQPQHSKGCVLSGPEEDREVHIIELKAPNSSSFFLSFQNSAFQVDVIVDISPLNTDQTLHRDLVLILKCEKAVNWVIKSHGVIGNLEVLNSDTVSVGHEMERRMHVVKKPKQSLPSGSRALIQWAEQHNYQPITSFTSTPVANHFTLSLREVEVMEEPHSMFPPELAILRNSNPLPGLDSTGGQGLPFPFHDLPWPDLTQPEEQQGALNVGLTVQCEEHRIVVAVDKESLHANGYSGSDLTLQDPSCTATANATHYILETSLNGCKTTKFPLIASTTAMYFNSSGAADFGACLCIRVQCMAFSYRSIFLSAQVQIPYLNNLSTECCEINSVIRQEPWEEFDFVFFSFFNCSYGQPLEDTVRRESPHRDPVNNVTFSMELFNTDLFRYPPYQAFLTTSESSQIFVEVSVTKADQELGFMIQTCFISPDSNPDVSSDYIIIENICPKDDSVKFYPPHRLALHIPHAQTDKKRFGFTFNSRYNISLLFLHCEMTLCTKKNAHRQGLPECIQPDEACTSVNVDTILAMMMHKKTSTKPLVVVRSPVEPEATLSDDNPQIHHPVQPPLAEPTMYGLDTPTVVGIAFAAFVIGALLTGALWFIYSHTGKPYSIHSSTRHQSILSVRGENPA
ncbi:TGBR3 factor, partial [Amia calva]|nr:TGBR3 factor [Amia calva]